MLRINYQLICRHVNEVSDYLLGILTGSFKIFVLYNMVELVNERKFILRLAYSGLY